MTAATLTGAVTLTVDAAAVDDVLAARLHAVLLAHPGERAVRLRLPRGGRVTSWRLGPTVTASGELAAALSDLGVEVAA